MNKSILLIICDFLLLSMLALVDFDATREPAPELDTAPAVDEGMQDDMLELLQLSLESEAAQREALAAEKEALEAAQVALEEERSALSEDLNLTQAERDELAAERARLEEEARQLSEQSAILAEEKAATEAALEETLQSRASLAENLETEASRARALQEELQERLAALAEAESLLDQTTQEAQELTRQRQQLEGQLQVAQTERAILQENLATARTEVELARLERQRAEVRSEQLAIGVTELAERSGAIEEEMRRAQPVSSNLIFSRYENNRLPLTFEATLDAFIGSRTETHSLDAVLVREGGRVLAVFEASQGPFQPSSLNRLRSVHGNFTLGGRNLEIVEISFLAADPRLIGVEIPARFLEGTALTPFELAEEPFRFPQAVLISNQLGLYGETDFRLVPGGQRYLSVNRSLFSQLRGEFQPSRGDYVFAKTGRLMGLMVEPERGVLLERLNTQAELPIGPQFDRERARELGSALLPRLPRVP